MPTLTILLTAGATLVVTVIAGLALDYFRSTKPKLQYSVSQAVPITLGEKVVGAYLISISNNSKHVAKEVNCHIDASPAKLRQGGVSAKQGVKYSTSETDDGLLLSISYMSPGDQVSITIVAESSISVPIAPNVAIRSPNEIRVAELKPGASPPSFRSGYALAALLSALVAGIATAILPLSSVADLYTQDPRDYFSFAASVAGLPSLAERYATSGDIAFHDQGDLAYALAQTSTDKKEVEKYRTMLDVVLDSKAPMVSASRACLLYSRAKIDLLLNDSGAAMRDFQAALHTNRHAVDNRLAVDTLARDFVKSNGLE